MQRLFKGKNGPIKQKLQQNLLTPFITNAIAW